MKDLIAMVAVACVIVFGMISCNRSDWFKQHEIDRIAKEQAEQTPHVIREADGCKVYAFKSGDRYHYFARCPDARTVTESSWDECHPIGSAKSKKCVTKTESIEVVK